MDEDIKNLLQLNMCNIEEDAICNKVILRINKSRMRKARIFTSIYSIFIVGTLVAIKPAVQFLFDGASRSGFTEYVSLLTSGSSIIFSEWKNLAMSIIESLPILEITTILSIVFVLVLCIRNVYLSLEKMSHYKYLPALSA